MDGKPELTKEEFVAKYPVSTRILWQHPKYHPYTWFPGVVVKPEREYPAFAPCVWFLLDFEQKAEGGDGASRFVGYRHRRLLELEPS